MPRKRGTLNSARGLADMLASMFGDISGLGTEADETCCPVCGSRFSDIAETGKAGLRRVLQDLLQRAAALP